MNEPIQGKSSETAGPSSEARPVVADPRLAVLMIVIMWLTGGKKPQTTAKRCAAVQHAAPVEVNETKIADLQNRIQELQTRTARCAERSRAAELACSGRCRRNSRRGNPLCCSEQRPGATH